MGRGRDKRMGTAVEQQGKHRRGGTLQNKQFRLSAVGSCDRKQTPTMFAGPAGVACTMLGPLDSSLLRHARSCTNRCCQL